MSGRMDWNKARFHGRATQDVNDNSDRDLGGRWLLQWAREIQRKKRRRKEGKRREQERATLDVDGIRMIVKRGSRAPNGVLVSYFGPPCPRCGAPSQVREHEHIGHRELRRPYYYSRWFFCIAVDCRCKTFMLDEFRVFNYADDTEVVRPLNETQRRLAAIAEQLNERPPWE